jgi:DNA gyrase inhibitor GyrI
MSDLDVRIVQLEPMRLISAWGFGPSPEEEAWNKLRAWAEPRGLMEDLEKNRTFGFNNPDPSPGSPNYGYELWIDAGPDVEPEGDLRVVGFDGGLYAVTLCEVPEGDFEVIGKTWKKLVAWREDSKYRCGAHQWLEKSVPPGRPGLAFALDLYLPIVE